MLEGLPITDPLLQFTVLVGCALLVQLTLERLHLPGIVGLLAIGAAIGPGGLGVLEFHDVVELLGLVGLVYLMFTAGIEIDLRVLRGHQQETLTHGFLAFALCVLPGVGLGLYLGLGWPGALLLGALLSSHTLVSYPLVVRYGLMHRHAVVVATASTVVTDALALVLLALVAGRAAGGPGPLGMDLGGWTWSLPLLLLAVLAIAAWAVIPRLSLRLLERQDVTRPEKALYVLLVLLVLSATADLIGTEQILGAFLAGLVLNRSLAARDVLREHVEFLGEMLFIPCFFIYTGMHLEVGVLLAGAAVWIPTAVLVGIVLLGKGGAAWITGARHGHPVSMRLVMLGLTMPLGAATLAITTVARSLGFLPEELLDVILLAIFVTSLAAPLLTQFASRAAARDGPPRVDGSSR